MSVYAQMASARLAKHDLQAKLLTAFAATSHFNPNEKSFRSVCVALPMPTADPVLLTKAAHALLPQVYEGVKYARAEIMVTDLRPSGNQKPLEIFENPHEELGIGTLLEDVSKRYGRGSIGLGHAGIRAGLDWSMKRDMLSPDTPRTGTNCPSSKPPKPSHSHDRTTKERPHMTLTPEAPTRTDDVQFRFDPASWPLAVRHDGRI
jgi:DNA polymerase V